MKSWMILFNLFLLKYSITLTKKYRYDTMRTWIFRGENEKYFRRINKHEGREL